LAFFEASSFFFEQYTTVTMATITRTIAKTMITYNQPDDFSLLANDFGSS